MANSQVFFCYLFQIFLPHLHILFTCQILNFKAVPARWQFTSMRVCVCICRDTITITNLVSKNTKLSHWTSLWNYFTESLILVLKGQMVMGGWFKFVFRSKLVFEVVFQHLIQFAQNQCSSWERLANGINAFPFSTSNLCWATGGDLVDTVVSNCLFFALLVIRQDVIQINLRNKKNIIPLPVW